MNTVVTFGLVGLSLLVDQLPADVRTELEPVAAVAFADVSSTPPVPAAAMI